MLSIIVINMKIMQWYAHLLLRRLEPLCLLRTKSQQHQQRELFHWRTLSPHIWHMWSECWMALRLASCGILSRPTNSSFLWSHSLRVSSAHPARPHRWSAYLATWDSSSDLTELGCQISCCVIRCWPNATQNKRIRIKIPLLDYCAHSVNRYVCIPV